MSATTEEQPQAKVSFKAYEHATPIDDTVISQKVDQVVDHHNELTAAMAVMKGEEAPELDEITTPEEAPVQTEAEHEAEVTAALQASPEEPEVEPEPTPEEPQVEEPKTAPELILAELAQTEVKIKSEREAIQAERVELNEAIGEFRQEIEQTRAKEANLEQHLRENPLAVLRHYGHSLNQLAKMALAEHQQGAPQALQVQTPQERELAELKAQNAQIMQMLQNQQPNSPANQAAAYETAIQTTLGTPDYAILKSYPGGEAAATKAAMEFAVGYMKKHGVDANTFTPTDALGRLKDGWEAHLKSIGAYESAVTTLGLTATAAAPPAPTAPTPTLTQTDEQPSPHEGVTDSEEPLSHRDEVMAALSKVPPGARRGFD